MNAGKDVVIIGAEELVNIYRLILLGRDDKKKFFIQVQKTDLLQTYDNIKTLLTRDEA